jgi:hypothetical protein
MFGFPNASASERDGEFLNPLIRLVPAVWHASCFAQGKNTQQEKQPGRNIMRCRNLADVGRRRFLMGSAAATAGAVALAGGQARAQTAAARVEYPSNRLANISDLTENEPFDVAYPDEDAPVCS